jgi:hypothetical protein
MPFTRGVQAGRGAAANPFGIILSKFREAEGRRLEEDRTRKKEEFELKKALDILGQKHEFDKELAEQEQKGKVELEEEKQKAKTTGIKELLGQFGIGGAELPVGTKASVDIGGGTKLNIPISRKFTGEEVKSLSTSDALTDEIGDLKTLISGRSAFKAQALGTLPFGAFTESGQSFKILKKSIGERLLRLRSGAQINEKEFKRFMGLLPAVTRIDKLDIKQLESFEKEFNSIRGRILSGAKFDEKIGEFTTGGGLSAGTQGDVVIMTDAKGNKARVRVDSQGKPIEVLEEL